MISALAGLGVGGFWLATMFLAAEFRSVTLIVGAGFLAVVFGFYFVSSGTPVFMHANGFNQFRAMFVTSMLTSGGAIGCVVFGFVTACWSTRSVLTWFTLLAGDLMAVFMTTASWVPLVILTGILLGVFANDCIAGLYTLTLLSVRRLDIEANRLPRQNLASGSCGFQPLTQLPCQ